MIGWNPFAAGNPAGVGQQTAVGQATVMGGMAAPRRAAKRRRTASKAKSPTRRAKARGGRRVKARMVKGSRAAKNYMAKIRRKRRK